MKKVLKFVLFSVAVLIVGVIAAYVVLLKSGPGQQFVFRTIVPIVERSAGIKIEAGEVGGSWPEDFHFKELTLRDSEGVWLYADHVDFVWHPLALRNNHVKIDFVLLTDAEMFRMPVLPPSEEEKTGGGFSLPLITIADSEIANVKIHEPVVGKELEAGGKIVAEFSSKMAKGDVGLVIQSGSQTSVTASLDWQPQAERFDAGLELTEGPGGLIGFFAGLDPSDQLALSLKGDGPAEAWRGELTGSLPGLVTMQADLTCACTDFASLAVGALIELGSGAPAAVTGWLGDNLTVDLTKTRERKSDLYEVMLGSAMGPLNASIRHTGMRKKNAFEIAADLLPAGSESNAALRKLGTKIELASQLHVSDGEVRIDTAQVSSDHVTVILEETEVIGGALRKTSARGSLLLDPWMTVPEDLHENTLSFKIDAEPAGEENLSLSGKADDTHGLIRLSFNGEAARNFEVFKIGLAGQASEMPVDALLGAVDVRSPLEYDVDVEQTAAESGARLDVQAVVTWDSFGVAGDDVRTLRLETDVSQIEGILEGSVNATGEVRKFDTFSPLTLTAQFSREGTALALSELAANLPGAAISAAGTIQEGEPLPLGRVSAQITNLSDVPFVPAGWTGALTVSAQNDPQRSTQSPVSIDVSSEALNLGEQRIAGLKVRGTGTAEVLSIDSALAHFGDPEAPTLSDVKARTVLSLGEAETRIRLEQFSAVAADELFQLERPAVLSLTERGPSLSGLKLVTSRGGIVSLSAQPTGSEGLTALLKTTDLLIPTTAVSATGEVKLNTGQTTESAQLEFALAPVGQPNAPEFHLTGGWNGRKVDLSGFLQLKGSPTEGDAARSARTRFFRLGLPAGRNADGALELGDLDGRLDYSGRLEDLLAFLDLEGQTAAGQLVLSGRLTGPTNAPSIDAQVSLSDAHYVHDDAGIDVMQAQLKADFSGTPGQGKGSVSLTASDGSDSASARAYGATADIRLPEQGPLTLSALVTLQDAAIVQREDLTAEASSSLKLEGPLNDLKLTGEINVRNVDYVIPAPQASKVEKLTIVRVDKNRSAEAEEDEDSGPSALDGVAINVAVRADNRVYIRGRGLDTEWSANVKATGTAARPVLDGKLSVLRGFLDFGGRKFDFEKGIVTFDPNGGLDPFLNIAASNETKGDIKAGLKVSRRASKPSISLYSEPSLPEEDVMAYVLFGKPAQKLSSLEALQVARAVATLTGTGGLGGAGALDWARKFAGVDVLTISTEGDAPGLSVGKYIRDGVYVSANQDLSGKAGSVSVEIEATDNITLETDVGQDADASVSINWKRDY